MGVFKKKQTPNQNNEQYIRYGNNKNRNNQTNGREGGKKVLMTVTIVVTDSLRQKL